MLFLHFFSRYVPYCEVENDLFCRSHFNFEVDGLNYHILRTGAFPFVKFHCSQRPKEDLRIEDVFYGTLKVLNLGLTESATGLTFDALDDTGSGWVTFENVQEVTCHSSSYDSMTVR